jgi:hypothetical protein
MIGKLLPLVAVGLGFATFAPPASAAPLPAAPGIERDAGMAEPVRSRRCWRHRGHWHCSRGYRHYGYGPGYYGYGPSFGLYFGGGHRHRHWGHRHRHW